MTRFEDLGGNVRALLLAKLALEINAGGCANLHELARKRHTDPINIWRGICRTAKQPPCAMPAEAVEPNRWRPGLKRRVSIVRLATRRSAAVCI